MPESLSHKRLKLRAAGKKGKTEFPLSRRRRLDAATGKKAVEIELSGDRNRLEKAIKRLRDSGKPSRILRVPQKDIHKAAKIMQQMGVQGTVTNLKGTKRQRVQ